MGLYVAALLLLPRTCSYGFVFCCMAHRCSIRS